MECRDQRDKQYKSSLEKIETIIKVKEKEIFIVLER